MQKSEISTIGIGSQFGRWTVSGACLQSGASNRKWLCRCECGTQRYVLERNLLYGNSVSCGCLRKERANHAPQKFRDISGKRFARLVALEPTKRVDPNGFMIWRCRCDCGTEIDVSYNSLMYGNQKSCGCQKKEHDQKLNTYLTHVAGTSVDMLKSKKIPKDNTTGYKGVYLVRGRYLAKIVFQKKQYVLGMYDQIEDAAEARREAEEVLFVGVAEHYQKWKEIAETDPEWARENPFQVIVNQNDGRLNVTMLPNIRENKKKSTMKAAAAATLTAAQRP